MEGRNERQYTRLGRNGKGQRSREMRNRKDSETGELRIQELERGALLMCRRRKRAIPVVHPHAGGSGPGEVGMLQILQELIAVAPTPNHDRQSEKRENTGVEELPNGCYPIR